MWIAYSNTSKIMRKFTRINEEILNNIEKQRWALSYYFSIGICNSIIIPHQKIIREIVHLFVAKIIEKKKVTLLTSRMYSNISTNHKLTLYVLIEGMKNDFPFSTQRWSDRLFSLFVQHTMILKWKNILSPIVLCLIFLQSPISHRVQYMVKIFLAFAFIIETFRTCAKIYSQN